MREIEFRAWLKDEEKMVKAERLGLFEDVEKRFVIWKVKPYEHSFKYLKDVELMQYTGLKDKNGVKIFEGDIVNNGESENLIVLWSDKYQSFIIDEKIGVYTEQNDDRLYDCDDIEEYEPFKYKCGSYEVIGNIYKNPELLEKK